MKTAIISSSQLFKHGRWDAGFHLLNEEYQDRASALSAIMTKEAALALLADEKSIPTQALQLLAPLARGQNQDKSRDGLLRAAMEYPFLALAIVKDKGRDIIETKRQELEESARQLAQAQRALDEAGPSLTEIPPIPSGARGEVDKNRYVQGVVYFDGTTLSIPVETSPTAYVADCWVIEANEWTGPRMIDDLVSDGEVPVPRRHEDLGKPIGFFEQLADHTQNYGRGWRQTP